MRFLSLIVNDTPTIAARSPAGLHDLRRIDSGLPDALNAVFAGGEEGLAALGRAAAAADRGSLVEGQVAYRPVLPRPGKVICIGRNYAAHAREGGAEPLSYPDVFLRAATSLVGHEAPLVRPLASEQFDYEAELVVVIGRTCRHATLATALDHVFGYTLFNEGSVRDYQRKATQWTIGKNFDGTGAFGPEIVTADELPPGGVGLAITATLNGQRMQDSTTADLIFPVDRLIEILSECMTLEPGDVILTGTPSGVGYARKPPVFLKAGDRIDVEVEGIGRLSNPVVDATAA